jgi:hypothetical protein
MNFGNKIERNYLNTLQIRLLFTLLFILFFINFAQQCDE